MYFAISLKWSRKNCNYRERTCACVYVNVMARYCKFYGLKYWIVKLKFEIKIYHVYKENGHFLKQTVAGVCAI